MTGGEKIKLYVFYIYFINYHNLEWIMQISPKISIFYQWKSSLVYFCVEKLYFMLIKQSYA